MRLIALGGLGEIGMNCLVLEHQGEPCRRLMIDCGVVYPHGDVGVDCYHPCFDYFVDGNTPRSLDAVVLTHGHEDHIGGLPYLLAELRARGLALPPVFGPPYAIALCRRRLVEHGFADGSVALWAIEPGSRFNAAGLSIESVRVTHSMLDATALAIDTPVGRVVHSGDFKLDPEPILGLTTDTAALERWGREGVRLLLSDSTNVLSSGSTSSESVAAAALDRIVGRCSGRVVVGLFASNLHRLEALARAASQHGRRLCLLGRSLHTHGDVGRELGRITWPSDHVVSAEVATTLPRRSVLWAATGTQGEPRGALRRLASRRHPDLDLEPGDTVVLSSRVIPGNERAVVAMLDDFVRQGVELRTRWTDPDVHVSGHAQRDEQLELIALTKPHAFIPLHGTHMHLAEHARLAREAGVEQVQVLANGDTLRLTPDLVELQEPVGWRKVAVAGLQVLDEEVLQQRRQMGRSGLVQVIVSRSGEEVVVRVRARGLPMAERVERESSAVAAALWRRGAGDKEELTALVRARVRELIGIRPVVDVIVMDP